MLEILAPAGNTECANAAINNGANAIYLGFSAFSARQGADNFDLESLQTTVRNAHFCDTKVYVAMNTLIKDEELPSFLESVIAVWNAGADAIILQDIFLGKVIKNAYPDIVLHLSTQAGVCNTDGALLAKEYGFSRVILARETPLKEIEKIAQIIETEAFVQGALCTAFSGQCYFSSFAGGNSGNRGRCKQPCRKQYTYNRNGFEGKAYALSLSDLCVGEDISKYVAAGVTSFKIEGRMRRAEYVAAAVRYYRSLLDGQQQRQIDAALSNLKRTYNRGNYTKGLAFGQDKRFLSTAIQGHIGEKIGVIKVVNGKYLVESSFAPSQGDAFKILRGGQEVGGATFEKQIGKAFTVFSKTRLKNGDGVFITTDNAVSKRVLSAQKTGEVALRLRFVENQFAVIEGGGVQIRSEEKMQTSLSRPLTEEELRSCFSKTDGLPVRVCFESIEIDGNIFIPKSKLNALRRTFFDELARKVVYGDRKLLKPRDIALPDNHMIKTVNAKIAVISNDFTDIEADIAVYKAEDYSLPPNHSFLAGSFEKYVYYPPFATQADREQMQKWIATYHLDGVYAENYGGITFAKQCGVKLFAGTGFNLFNLLSVNELLKETCVAYYAVSKELNVTEATPLLSEKAFVLGAGDIKLMDLCYCPFGKTCGNCDKRRVYLLTDENNRAFPVHRYVNADGNCRFEVYNCAKQISENRNGVSVLLDTTTIEEKSAIMQAKSDAESQKKLFENYTSGHQRRGVL